MAAERQAEVYDLLIVADATASMQTYLTSLRVSLPQIISVSALTNSFSRIGLLYYRDYDMSDPLEWHGWIEPSKLVGPNQNDQPDLVSIAKNVQADGGGDYAEATKTALAKVYEVSRAEATTIVLLYTDAPPHAISNGGKGLDGYGPTERKALEKGKHAIHGRHFVDWTSACGTLRNGGKRIHVYTIIDSSISEENLGFYNYLSTMTGGACLHLKRGLQQPAAISRITVELLLTWMGVEKAGLSDAAKNEDLGAMLSRYIDISNIKKVTNESSKDAQKFFNSNIIGNTTKITLTPETLRKYLPKKTTPVAEFTQQWKSDGNYREFAISHLERMIQHDVRAMALNPVLGSLWRIFCNDRTIPNREEVLASFSQGITKISDEKERAQMKAWLEESYDFAAQIQETIETVPEEARFPCVYLDPTLKFERADSNTDDDEDANRAITEFKRDELLEIGRSCDYKILRRLGRILTRLTYVEKASDMPQHITKTTDEDLPKIPIALASQEYKTNFWRVLLHAVLPGTMLGARPATLLAALSLRMGVEPLREVAEHQMRAWKTKWNDTEVPETWNIGCLTLLLDADKAYRQRRESSDQEIGESLLRKSDRRIFETLVDFKILERNLDTPLVAKVGWTPNKSSLPMGPVVDCRKCKFPRSVTIMGKSGQCGLCLTDDFETKEERLTHITTDVSKDDNELTEATWVECSVITCRAQYIVYHQDSLRVRAKCHYCRLQKDLPETQRSASPAPTVECGRCLNRMIYPKTYRPSPFSESDFLCVACTSSRITITETETSAKQISDENTTDWLAVDAEAPSKSPFSNRSVYHTITTIGTDEFLNRVKLFPKTDGPLRRRGKVIHNSQELIEKLQKQVSRRHAKRVPCSLCFSEFQPRDLNAACGRRGCFQRICRGCLDGWYGLNSAGRILNTASLFCAFCRRQPRAQTLAKHGMGVHSVGNLAQAVQDQGNWIYAWCESCAYAKPFVERVCARGVPADVEHWACDECHEQQAREEEARRLEEIESRRIAAQIQGNIRAAEEAERNRRRLLKKREEKIQSKRKPCPGCGVECEKSMGCGHMTCPVPRCLTHWCFFCGKKCDPRGIYHHMSTAHGGFFDGDSESERE
ncbi:uncharacterized protein TRUGW13939_02180 [Talaromyces rugulosus]|uniref:RING-type domain-containing protein n=1 Tax=Talaromyces rugulosus TaxID=121627 RepID=A0A7H8QMJ3_TALRU|nr:uncharacterized protein TRUGW13939_02180 [Talaromyces rugulosus]QKX55088.1 hypothetical protein TRUGW13939_02180 [Talaromyces rugulosus]